LNEIRTVKYDDSFERAKSMIAGRRISRRCPKTGRIIGSDKRDRLPSILFFIAGFFSLVWFLIRVLPKPSRASYPCMKTAMPLAASFVTYLFAVAGSVLFFRKFLVYIRRRQFFYSMVLLVFALGTVTLTVVQRSNTASAASGVTMLFSDPLGPNVPIGDAKGVIPGRVVWVHDPLATNPYCAPASYGDGYFLDVNCDQQVVDEMVSLAIRSLVGTTSDETAWDSIFRYFNRLQGKGNAGYLSGEKIFIKINSVHAWNTEADGSISDDKYYGTVDTSPQVVLSLLRQLVEKSGVPQEMIYVGDPFTRMFNHCYDKWSAEFPHIHYMSRDPLPGRETFTKSTDRAVYYSDAGTVINKLSDKMVDQFEQAEYLINIPAMKGHRWGGVTFFAKNHFGSHASGTSSHLHDALHRSDYDMPLRDQYKSYRVFVDYMASAELGGKTLLYLMDGLWATSEEHLPPVKFRTAPFDGHWSSSIFASLDPVAIESVCLDVMQKEFVIDEPDADPPRYAFVQWGAIDDYLHQAADADWWPEGITYDPDKTGNPIPSLGVHEHWNNDEDMLYSGNLGTGSGIELLKKFAGQTLVEDQLMKDPVLTIFPNPVRDNATISLVISNTSHVEIDIYTVQGEKVLDLFNGVMASGENRLNIDVSHFNSGIYTCILRVDGVKDKRSESMKILVVK
jgi:hypothetical protein